MKTIEHYRDSTGRAPFQTWFQTLRDKVAKASIARRLDRLAIGNPGDHKAVREGVSELRIDVGSGYRVYYAKQGERLVTCCAVATNQPSARISNLRWNIGQTGKGDANEQEGKRIS
jgi:putative addiction module killer protein